MGGGSVLTEEIIAQSTGRAIQRYDRDSNDHYAVISALIKSIRGSDPDAALYWLARMLEAGDDLRFITRRLCILASEDVGLADPMALVIAQNAAAAVDRVGMPEASIILGEAVIYLAAAPKSNSAYLAIAAAQKNVREGSLLEVPSHLRNDGEGYVYPHDSPAHWTPQAYLPEVARRGAAHRRALQTPLEKILVGGRNGEKIVKPPPPPIEYKNAAAYIPRRRFA